MQKPSQTHSPTDVSKQKRNRIIHVCSIVILSLLGLAIIMEIASDVHTHRSIATHGVETTAVVSGKDSYTSLRAGPSYYLDYEFTPQRGSKPFIAHHKAVYGPEWQYYNIGQQIPVSFIPNDPSQNLPTFAVNRLAPTDGLFIFVALVALPLVPMLYLIGHSKLNKSQRQQRRMAVYTVCVLLAFLAYRPALIAVNRLIFST